MRDNFGQLRRLETLQPAQLRLDAYHQHKQAKAREQQRDEALVWVLYYCLVGASLCILTPEAAVAGICTVGLADCGWQVR